MSAAKSSVSPGAGASASSSCSERNFAIGERISPALVADDVGEALGAELLRPLLERGDLGARVHARHAEEPHGLGARRRRRTRSRASTAVASSISSAKRVSGLSEPKRRSASAYVMCGNGRGISIPRHSRQTAANVSSISSEQLVAVGERHLHVELGDLLDAVGAEVLVPEADRDLVVAVEAGDHRQLLQELRALRQREERPLWSRLGTTKSRAPSGVDL